MRIAVFSGRGNPHSTFPGQRTFCFANAAADTAFVYNIRLLDQDLFVFAVHYPGFTKLDSLVRRGAVFFTDNTGNSLGKRQTAVLIKKNIADFCGMLLGQGKFGKRPGWTHLAAQGAIVFTITVSGLQPW